MLPIGTIESRNYFSFDEIEKKVIYVSNLNKSDGCISN